MNYLIVVDSNSSSAIHDIAIKVANRLSKTNNVYALYYLSYGKLELPNYDIFNKEFFLQNQCVVNHYKEKITSGWFDKKWNNKILYLMNNPLFIFNQLVAERSFSKEETKYIRRINEICEICEIDVVLGFAFPFEILKLISEVKGNRKKYGIQLDPYTYNSRLEKKKKDRRLKEEKKVFSKLSKLFSTKLIIDDLLEHEIYSENRKKLIEIEFPKIDLSKSPDEYVKNDIIKPKELEEVTFLHAGLFYEDIRNPKYLAELFENLPDNYILYVAGPNCEDILKYFRGGKNRIKVLGELSHENIESVYESVDFLISYNNTIYNQVPSKLFECINTGKPFINLCQIENCPTLKYVENYNYACNVFTFKYKNDIDNIKKFVDSMKGKRCAREYILSKYKKCTIEYVCSQIEAATKEGMNIN